MATRAPTTPIFQRITAQARKIEFANTSRKKGSKNRCSIDWWIARVILYSIQAMFCQRTHFLPTIPIETHYSIFVVMWLFHRPTAYLRLSYRIPKITEPMRFSSLISLSLSLYEFQTVIQPIYFSLNFIPFDNLSWIFFYSLLFWDNHSRAVQTRSAQFMIVVWQMNK